MAGDASRETNGVKETILEFIVRDRFTKQQIRDLLDSVGGSTSGNREEMAERLLAERGLKVREALSLLSLDDLKRVAKRFDIPVSSGSGLLTTLFGDEKAELTERIAKVAAKQRSPEPRLRGIPASEIAAPPIAPVSHSGPASTASRPPSVRTTSTSGVLTEGPNTSQAAGLPSFQEVRDFVGAYKFAYQWGSEDLYESELLGALRGRFGINNAIRQQGESGRVYDIVVRNSAHIEMKLPKSKGDLDKMVGQVTRYLSQHPGGVIVVIMKLQMKNQQEIHDAQEDLERAGAVVFVK